MNANKPKEEKKASGHGKPDRPKRISIPRIYHVNEQIAARIIENAKKIYSVNEHKR